MNYFLFSIISFLAGLFIGSYKEWFSHNLNLNLEKKKQKITLYRTFVIQGANIIENALQFIYEKQVRTELEARKLKNEVLNNLDYIEELKLLVSEQIYKEISKFKKIVVEFYEMLGDLALLFENKKIKQQEVIYFLYSILEDNFKDKTQEISADPTVNKDVLSFLIKYSGKKYFFDIRTIYSETSELMRKELI